MNHSTTTSPNSTEITFNTYTLRHSRDEILQAKTVDIAIQNTATNLRSRKYGNLEVYTYHSIIFILLRSSKEGFQSFQIAWNNIKQHIFPHSPYSNYRYDTELKGVTMDDMDVTLYQIAGGSIPSNIGLNQDEIKQLQKFAQEIKQGKNQTNSEFLAVIRNYSNTVSGMDQNGVRINQNSEGVIRFTSEFVSELVRRL